MPWTQRKVLPCNSRSCNKTKDQAPEDKSFGACIIICTDRHEDPFIVIKNRVYNDTLALANEDATALATLLGTVSMQHDTYLPWWRQNNAFSIKQPSRSKTTASDDNASDISEIPRDNDYPKNICGSSYFQLGRKYHGPHVEDFSTQVAALIAQGKQALKNLRIQDGECAFECATKGKLTPEHFCQAGRMAWDEGESKLALQLFYFQKTLKAKLRQPVTVSLTSVNPISVCALPVDAITAIKHRLAYCEAVRNLFPFAVDLLQVYTACPHCKQQSKHLNNTVMAFFTEQGLTPKLNGKEPDLAIIKGEI
ncbi:hypothetical protein WJX82_000963 [Trebouxia sp. C0006]